MDFALRWYSRFRSLVHEAAKFGVVGIAGLVVTDGVYFFLHSRSIGTGPITATTIATILATVVTYLGNRYWSFSYRQRTGVAREGVIFLVLNGVGLLIQDAFVGFNAYALGLEYNKVAEFIALNFGIAVATLFRFWSYRKWVWAAPAAADGGSVSTDPPADGPSGPAVATPLSADLPTGQPGARPAGTEPVRGNEWALGERRPLADSTRTGPNGRDRVPVGRVGADRAPAGRAPVSRNGGERVMAERTTGEHPVQASGDGSSGWAPDGYPRWDSTPPPGHRPADG